MFSSDRATPVAHHVILSEAKDLVAIATGVLVERP